MLHYIPYSSETNLDVDAVSVKSVWAHINFVKKNVC